MRTSDTLPITAAAGFIVLSMPHIMEDIGYGETARLGLNLIHAGLIIGLLQAALVVAAFDAVRGGRFGGWGMIAIGLIWSVGAVLIHGGEIAHAGWAFREGFASVMALAALFGFAFVVIGVGIRTLLRPLNSD